MRDVTLSYTRVVYTLKTNNILWSTKELTLELVKDFRNLGTAHATTIRPRHFNSTVCDSHDRCDHLFPKYDKGAIHSY